MVFHGITVVLTLKYNVDMKEKRRKKGISIKLFWRLEEETYMIFLMLNSMSMLIF